MKPAEAAFVADCVISPDESRRVRALSAPPTESEPTPCDMRRLRPPPAPFVFEIVTWTMVDPPTVRQLESTDKVTDGAEPPECQPLQPVGELASPAVRCCTACGDDEAQRRCPEHRRNISRTLLRRGMTVRCRRSRSRRDAHDARRLRHSREPLHRSRERQALVREADHSCVAGQAHGSQYPSFEPVRVDLESLGNPMALSSKHLELLPAAHGCGCQEVSAPLWLALACFRWRIRKRRRRQPAVTR
jgi:hypothetical protein